MVVMITSSSLPHSFSLSLSLSADVTAGRAELLQTRRDKEAIKCNKGGAASTARPA